MDLDTLLALRSPAGVPSHPAIFLALGVLTWALHILAVHLTLGSAFLSLMSINRGGAQAPYWRRLGRMLLEHAKVGVSIAIVLGVAPLLFVQVIYDPMWYVSNVLSARWAIAFIVFLLLAYWLWWLFYGTSRKAADGQPVATVWGWLAFGLFLVIGFVMHGLTSQMLHPDEWLAWYAPDGQIDASGSAIHAYHPARFAFMLLLALPVVGAWLLACRQYLAGREDEDTGYLDFLRAQGVRWVTLGGALAFIAFIVWMFTLPMKAGGFAFSPWSILVAMALAALVALAHRPISGFLLAGVALGADLVVGILREAYRLEVLYGVHGYNPLDYAINMDWYSTVLFFATFALLGGSAVSFMLSLAWKAGQMRGVYTAGAVVSRLANWTLIFSVLWMVQYFAFGAWVLAKD